MEETVHVKAMTLRDYFAGQILAGISAMQGKGEFHNIEDAYEAQAKYCYQLADEMLKQREIKK